METKYRHYMTVVLIPLFVGVALLLAGCGKASKIGADGGGLDGTDNTPPITTASPTSMGTGDDLLIGSVEVTLDCVDFGGGGAGGAGGGSGGYGPVMAKSHAAGCAVTYWSKSKDEMNLDPPGPTITYDGPITITNELSEIRLKFFSIDEAGNREEVREAIYYFDAVPTVASTSPDNNGTLSSAGTDITATFSKAMDEETLTIESFTVSDGAGDIPGVVTYDSGTNTTIFNPTNDLIEESGYIATITADVTDADGLAMNEDYSWSFTVSAGGGGGGGGGGGTTYTVGGTLSGLTGTGLVLQNNGGDDLSLTADGSFTFATAIADTLAYNVTVLTNPSGQTCAVTGGNGTISGAEVTDVSVTCTDIPAGSYTVGGTLSGLTGTGLVLQNNGGDDSSLTADGSFTFATAIADTLAYAVTVLTDPTGQTCAVTGGNGGGDDGTGTISGANVTDIVVTCTNSAVGGFDAPLTRVASNSSYGSNTFGLITAGTLENWRSDWAANAPSAVTGKLIILHQGAGNVVASTCTANPSFTVPYNAYVASTYEEKRNNGLFDTVMMVADGASADAFLKMYNIDPVNDMVVVAMTSYSSTNFFRYGRIYYMLRYWGMAADHLALLNGSVSSNSGSITTMASACSHPNSGTVTVASLPDNTGLQASTGEMLAVARGDYTPSNGAFLWDVRTNGEYLGTPTGFTKDESGAYVAFEGTIRVGSNAGGWLEWTSVINTTTGAFNSKASLQGALSTLGYNGTATIYTWCRTAYRAMASLVVSEVIMGYPTKLYDGSWIEWGELTNSDNGGLQASSVYAADNAASTDNLAGPTGATSSTNITGKVTNPTTASAVIIADKAYKGVTWTSGLSVPGATGGEEY